MSPDPPDDHAAPTGDYDSKPDSNSAAADRVGERIGPFKLLQLLGEGGMGVVYVAEQSEPVRRRVALKIIKPGVATAHVLARFEQERQALALMDHPNIAKVLDAGESPPVAPGGLPSPYIVMELVKGVPITKFCDDAKLTPRQRLELFIPVCQAIQHAHQKGIIHRDLKPSNVLIAIYDGKPVPKVIDFGVAKATGPRLTEHTVFTDIGNIIGTLEYMAPEQAELNNLDIDTRADVYALGVILYELLTGSVPFSRKELQAAGLGEMIRVIQQVEPTKPSTKISSSLSLPSIAAVRQMDPRKLTQLVRGELDWITMKALEKDRSRRYETANALAIEIQRYLNDEPVLAAAPSAGYRLRKVIRKHRGRFIAAGLVLVTLVGGLIGSLTQAYRATRAEGELRTSLGEKQTALDNETKERKRAEENAELAKKKTDEAEFEAYVANLIAADASFLAVEPARVRARLDACPAHFRNWEWRWLDAKSDTSLVELRGHQKEVLSASFSPSGELIVTRSYDKTARVWNAATGKELVVLRGHEAVVWSAQFGLSDDRIVTAGDTTARLWNAVTGKELAVMRGHKKEVRSATFNVQGDRLVTGSFDNTARVWDTASGQELMVLRGHEAAVLSAEFSPQGDRIVTAGGRTARVWDAATGKELAVLHGHEMNVSRARFSASGDRIVTLSVDEAARVWDATTGKELAVVRGHEAAVWSAAFTSSGDRIVTASADGTAKVWEVATGKELVVLRGHQGTVSNAEFNQSGDRIVTASTDQTARVWDSATGKELTVLRGHNGSINTAKFCPSGNRIITASGDHTARLWDAASSQEGIVLRGHDSIVASAEFRKSGEQIVSGSWDKTARVWDAVTGKVLVVLRGHQAAVSSARFNASGDRVVTASRDKTARVWDAVTGKELVVMRGHQGIVWSAEYNMAGDRIVTASQDKTARVWDASTGKELALVRGHEANVCTAKFSRLGDRIITASWDKTARVTDTVAGNELLVLRGHDSEVYSADINSAGDRIVTASADKTAKIWDASTGKEIAVLHASDQGATAAMFNPSGDRVVTVSFFGLTGQVWDTATGKELAVLRVHEAEFWSAAFNTSGDRIVTASGDKTARVWDSVRYRDRFPAIQAARAAENDMLKRLTPRVSEIEDLDVIVNSLVVDRTLDEVHRRAGLAIVCEERERRLKEKAK